METNSSSTAQEQLDALATSREQVLDRITLPWWNVVALAIFMNACMIALVAPILLSWGWSMAVQGLLTVGLVVLVVMQGGRERVKRPRVHVPGAWVVTAGGLLVLGAALAVGVYARIHDNAWLGGAALVVNFAGYLVTYGGLGFLLRRQYARLG